MTLINILLAALLCAATVDAELQAGQGLETTWRNTNDLRGELVELNAGDDSFVAIHLPQDTAEPLGAVVLLHDIGTNANSHDVIRPLRVGLPAVGWETLSLQLPAAHAGAWTDHRDAIVARLQAALDWLSSHQQLNQAVIALGESGSIALRFAAERGPKTLQALVLLSVPGDFSDESDRQALQKLERPLLDLYAEHDLAVVVEGAVARARAAREAELGAYRQRTISGASTGFRGLDAQLLSSIRAWLHAYASGKEIK